MLFGQILMLLCAKKKVYITLSTLMLVDIGFSILLRKDLRQYLDLRTMLLHIISVTILCNDNFNYKNSIKTFTSQKT